MKDLEGTAAVEAKVEKVVWEETAAAVLWQEEPEEHREPQGREGQPGIMEPWGK